MLADVDTNPTSYQSDVDGKWATLLPPGRLRTRLLIASSLGTVLLAPQLLFLAAKEALSSCPDGPPRDDLQGLDIVFECLLGIGDDSKSASSGTLWGGVDTGLAAEIIANQHFNRSVSIGHQLAWIDRAWFQDWPQTTAATKTVEGQPRDLFKEATGVELEEFAAVAFCVYIQADLNKICRFPDRFFADLGLKDKTINHFLQSTSVPLDELRRKIFQEESNARNSRYAIDTIRRFPLVRLGTGELLLLSPNLLVQRTLSEVTYFDVEDYLNKFDAREGTKRKEAFNRCTNLVLEHEVGVSLGRLFSGRERRVFSESYLQNRFGSKRFTPSVCDYVVKTRNAWLLFEVTDRSLPVTVKFANCDSGDLDTELDLVLTMRKAKQLVSTRNLIEDSLLKTGRPTSGGALYFVPLVVTSPGGMPWNPAVHQRTKERLSSLARIPDEFPTSIALITLKDVRMLENAASLGTDVADVLIQWRRTDPGSPLDQFMVSRGVPVGSPKWERDKAVEVINRFQLRMKVEK